MKLHLLFWPFVIVILVAIALFLAEPLGAAEQQAGGSELRAIFTIVFGAGITIAAGGRLLYRGGARSARYAVLWLGAFAGITVAYAGRVELALLYERMRGNVYPSVALSTAVGEAELRRAWDGHYRAEAQINGARLTLMVDTGASMVLLPYEKMMALGIDPNTLDYSLPVTTANGRSSVAPVTLRSIAIGPIYVEEVKAAVAQQGRLKVGLLGMSFLEKLRETTFRGDKLILKQ